MVYEYYTLAKKTLGLGRAECQKAKDAVAQTQVICDRADQLLLRTAYLCDALREQLGQLQTLQAAFEAEVSNNETKFRISLQELDSVNGELDATVSMLQRTSLASELLDNSGKAEHANIVLWDFADAAAIDTTKSSLREAIDHMHDAQAFSQDILGRLRASLQPLGNSLVNLPDLVPPTRENHNAHQERSCREFKEVRETYIRGQEESLQEMANLLVQLSQHYDHTNTLFTADAGLLSEERHELLEIVETDAAQLENVEQELLDRVQDFDLDLSDLSDYCDKLVQRFNLLRGLFDSFERFDIADLVARYLAQDEEVSAIADRIQDLRTQMTLLDDHYRGFYESYHAMILEIARRAKYNTTIETFAQQTNDTLRRLAAEETSRRETFLRRHADTLPQNIWMPITAHPDIHTLEVVPSQVIPKLSRQLLEDAVDQLSR